jgi:hypothetical protein
VHQSVIIHHCVTFLSREKKRWSCKKSDFSFLCHPGEGRDPVISNTSGCRIKSGMTGERLFTALSKKSNQKKTPIRRGPALLAADGEL